MPQDGYRSRMKILALSGSARADSTNTALLRAVVACAHPDHDVFVFAGLGDLPVFSPDLEHHPLPPTVQNFADLIAASDCVILSSPEYVRSLPGGLKNAIDWLVSRQEIIGKPIALLHASHRGDDMLGQLRLVLSTVSQRFLPDLFLRFALMKLSPDEIARRLAEPQNRITIQQFLRSLTDHVAAGANPETRA